MRSTLPALLASLLLAASAIADAPPMQDALLDRLVGEWVLEGTIASDEWTHDVQAQWVLGHQYLRIDEISREKGEDGSPLYEATVFIGWDQPSVRYVCLWLDSTGGGGLANDVFGYADADGDRLAFVFGGGDSRIHNTFTYHRDDDRWDWAIDDERDGVLTVFARVTLARK